MIRSYLFVPGNRPERFGKAAACGAGAVIVDLEDSVPPAEKRTARAAVCSWMRETDGAAWVRVNGTETEFFEADLRALAGMPLLGLVLPKAESADELRRVAAILGARPMPVIPIIESAVGLWKALEIAQGPRTARLAFGSADFQLDTGIRGEDEALLLARSQLVFASRIARVAPPIDGITVQIDDTVQLERDVAHARSLGFGAKLCVHPVQIAAVERAFAPGEDEIRWARAVVDAYERAAGSAVRLDGKLIDLPVIDRARQLLDSVVAK